MAWAAKRARRFERLRVRDEINAQGHRWQSVGGATGASYVRCERCGLLLAAVVDLSKGYAVLRLCGVDDGSGVGLIGRGEKMPQCRGAQGGPRG